jgi:hypothetical protein
MIPLLFAVPAVAGTGLYLRWATVPVRAAFRLGRALGLADRRTP